LYELKYREDEMLMQMLMLMGCVVVVVLFDDSYNRPGLYGIAV